MPGCPIRFCPCLPSDLFAKLMANQLPFGYEKHIDFRDIGQYLYYGSTAPFVETFFQSAHLVERLSRKTRWSVDDVAVFDVL